MKVRTQIFPKIVKNDFNELINNNYGSANDNKHKKINQLIIFVS
jgi:hypothetical protein